MTTTETEFRERGMDWDNPRDVTLWLPGQYVDASTGIVCIDDRGVIDPATQQTPLQIFAMNEGLEPDLSIQEVGENPGALKFPGEDAGIATVIEMATSIGAGTAVGLAQRFAQVNGREFSVHTDVKKFEEENEKGCGLIGLVSTTPELFGLSPKQGHQLVEAALAIPTHEGGTIYLSTYTGDHRASAWVDSEVLSGSFRKTSPQGNIFLTESARVRDMFENENPNRGLAAFLGRNSVRVKPGDLMNAYQHMVAVIKPELGKNKPEYTVSREPSGLLVARNKGIISPLVK